MKRSFILCGVLAFVLAASAAFAGVLSFGKFAVNVPDGWTATPEGSTVNILRNDNAALVSITVEPMEDAALSDIAEAFVEAMNGSNLTMEGDSYIFDADYGNGTSTKCFLSGDGTNYALIVVTGLENAPDEVSAIIGSLQEK